MPTDDAKKEDIRRAWERANAEEAIRQRKQLTEQTLDKIVAQDEDEKVKFVVQTEEKSWEAVLTAYKKYAKPLGLEADKETGALVFATRQDAIDFFATQAKLGHQFLAIEYANGKPSGFCVLSCGDEKFFYKGTFNEVKAALEKDLERHPENEKLKAGLQAVTVQLELEDASKHSTVNMREELSKQRTAAQPSTAPTPKLK